MTSPIALSNLTAKPGLGQITLTWAVTDPNARGWPHRSLENVQVWASADNDRSNASVIGEGKTSFTHGGLTANATYYYWIRAYDKGSNADGSPDYSEWYPLSDTGGVQGQELIKTLTVPEVSDLVASGGVGQNTLSWTITDPNSSELGYLALRTVEVHASSTNDRDDATLVADGQTFSIHNGIAGGAAFYYWIRPKHSDGTYGDWFPSSSTDGVAATEASSIAYSSGVYGWVRLKPSNLVIEWGGDATDSSGDVAIALTEIVFADGPVQFKLMVSNDVPTNETYVATFKTLIITGSAYSAVFEVRKITSTAVTAAGAGIVVQWIAIAKPGSA